MKLIRELAVEPDALRDWQNARFVLSGVGFAEGRAISDYPSGWRKMVYTGLNRSQPVQRKQIEELLKRADSAIVVAPRKYEKVDTWPINALREHVQNPFDAVLIESDAGETAGCCPVGSLHIDHPSWQATTGFAIDRDAQKMADAAALLLVASKQISFVDPHFETHPRFMKPLAAFLHRAFRSTKQRVEYHLEADAGLGADEFAAALRRDLLARLPLPAGAAMTFVRWKRGADAQHARYILTEKGGISFDYGLDEDLSGNSTTNVSLLAREIWSKRWMDYQAGSKTFEFVDAFRIKDGKVGQVGVLNGNYVPLSQIPTLR